MVEREIITNGTGLCLYGSCRAVFPPIKIQSTLRRRAKKARLSASDETPFEVLPLDVDPSRPTTKDATVLICPTIADSRAFLRLKSRSKVEQIK
jgi:hypothetical protein